MATLSPMNSDSTTDRSPAETSLRVAVDAGFSGSNHSNNNNTNHSGGQNLSLRGSGSRVHAKLLQSPPGTLIAYEFLDASSAPPPDYTKSGTTNAEPPKWTWCLATLLEAPSANRHVIRVENLYVDNSGGAEQEDERGKGKSKGGTGTAAAAAAATSSPSPSASATPVKGKKKRDASAGATSTPAAATTPEAATAATTTGRRSRSCSVTADATDAALRGVGFTTQVSDRAYAIARMEEKARTEARRGSLAPNHGSDGDGDDDGGEEARAGAACPRTEEGRQLQRDINAALINYEFRLQQAKLAMNVVRGRELEARRRQREAEEALRRAQEDFAKAREGVGQLEAKHLREIQSYRVPPTIVRQVMYAVLSILGEAPRGWDDVAGTLRSRNFTERVLSFDPEALSHDAREAIVRRYVDDAKFTYEDAKKGSVAIAKLYRWIITQLDMTRASEDVMAVRAAKETVDAQVSAMRDELADARAALAGLEEELATMVEAYEDLEGPVDASAIYAAGSEGASDGEEGELAAAACGRLHPSGTTVTDEFPAVWRRPTEAEAPVYGGATPAASVLWVLGPSVAPGEVVRLTPEQLERIRAALLARSRGPSSPSGAAALAKAAAGDLSPIDGGGHARDAAAQQEQRRRELRELRERLASALDRVGDAEAAAAVRAAGGDDEDVAATAAADTIEAHIARLLEQLAAAEAREGGGGQPSLRPPRLVTTRHAKTFEGDEWDMVVADSPDELQRAFADDVAAICHVPNRAVGSVDYELGSLHLSFDVQHDARTPAAAVQAALDAGSYPAVELLYSQRHARRAALDDREALEEGRRRRLAALEAELEQAKEAEREAWEEVRGMQSALDQQRANLSQQMLAAQSSSQADALEDLKEHIALERMLRETAAVRATLAGKEQQRQLTEEALRQEQEAAEQYAARRESEGEALRATLGHTAREVAELTEENQGLRASAAQSELAPTLVTAPYTKVLEGDEWEMVLEDSPDDLRRAVVDDAAAACNVPNRAVTNVAWELGSLHLSFDVQHSARVDPDTMQAALDESEFSSVSGVYGKRHERRAALAEARREAERVAALEAEVRAARESELAARDEAVAQARRAAEEHARETEALQQALAARAEDGKAAEAARERELAERMAEQQRRIEELERERAEAERRAAELAAEREAAKEAEARGDVTYSYTKTLEGDEWEMVLEDSPDDLRRAVVDDAAAACNVPNRAVSGLEWELGSLHLRFDVQHSAALDPAEVQEGIDASDFASVNDVYGKRHARRAALEEERARRREQEAAAARAAALEQELERARDMLRDAEEESATTRAQLLESERRERERAREAAEMAEAAAEAAAAAAAAREASPTRSRLGGADGEEEEEGDAGAVSGGSDGGASPPPRPAPRHDSDELEDEEAALARERAERAAAAGAMRQLVEAERERSLEMDAVRARSRRAAEEVRQRMLEDDTLAEEEKASKAAKAQREEEERQQAAAAAAAEAQAQAEAAEKKKAEEEEELHRQQQQLLEKEQEKTQNAEEAAQARALGTAAADASNDEASVSEAVSSPLAVALLKHVSPQTWGELMMHSSFAGVVVFAFFSIVYKTYGV